MPVSYSDEPRLYKGSLVALRLAKYQSVGTGSRGTGISRLYRIQCRSSSVPIALSIFGVSTFKGLLSIPCEGRGARRPLGQSFREPVGPRPCLYRRSTVSK